ncbi:MAG TPA: hypothetical protein VG095_09400, partial [Chthoniobacterales bacterium]|nr:hypothetical protein [Chthoniobacterales bacterium]
APRLRDLLLQKDEAAPPLYMKTRIISLCLIFLCSVAPQALACAVCISGRDSKTTQSMAVAIWFLLGAVMAVLGGFGIFGFHLWRHGRMPLQPHQELAEEDLEKYE